MPELPEVETIRRDLQNKIIGKTITAVEVRDQKAVSVSLRGARYERRGNLLNLSNTGNKGITTLSSVARDDKLFIQQLIKNKITAIERRGKLLMFKLQSGNYLLIHLKMTGQLIYAPTTPRPSSGRRGKRFAPPYGGGDEGVVAGGHNLTTADLQLPNRFTRVTISFADKTKLYFNDMRRFGYMKIVSAEEKEKIVKNDYGLEPLTPDFTLAAFVKLFAHRKTNIKALLMNQKLIAGLGNIYADEVCFCARVLPWRRVGSLKPAEIKKLFQCIPHILKIAIKNRGTTFSHFVDGGGRKGNHLQFLNVYGRAGEKCKRCGGIIKKTRHAGRGTHYCPRCQK